jgi:hypothetical protein
MIFVESLEEYSVYFGEKDFALVLLMGLVGASVRL